MKKVILSLTLFSLLIASCKKEESQIVTPPTPPPPPPPEIVTDIDGNDYNIIVVDSQKWMAENLRTSKYCNGDSIPNVTVDNQWSSLTAGAWSHYNNEDQYENPYGKLYNWYAMVDSRNICPCGWHVPTDAEWTTLIDFLDGATVAGGKMKSTGTQYWQSPNTDATNVSGFSGLPGGYRYASGTFNAINNNGNWWSSTEDGTYDAWFRALNYSNGNALLYSNSKKFGFSVRCVMD